MMPPRPATVHRSLIAQGLPIAVIHKLVDATCYGPPSCGASLISSARQVIHALGSMHWRLPAMLLKNVLGTGP